MTFYPGVRPLQLVTPASGIRTAPLFESSRDSYTKNIKPVEARQIEPNGAGVQKPSAKPRPHVLAAIAEGNLPGSDATAGASRIIVVGDGDFASNSFLPYMANSDLALAMVRWLVREERASTVASRIPVPPTILLTQTQMRTIFLLVEVLLPLTIVALGALAWWKHR